MGACRIAIFASGAGTTAEAVIFASKSGRLSAQTVLVIGNNSQAGVFARAAAHAVPARHISGLTHPHDRDRDTASLAALREHAATHIVLAGYMKRLGPATLAEFAGRVFNTHPSLLPAFGGKGMYGDRVHAAVLASGVTTTGATVHLVTDEYDEGSLIAQVRVAVLPDDDVARLAHRVQAAERELLINALRDRLDK